MQCIKWKEKYHDIRSFCFFTSFLKHPYICRCSVRLSSSSSGKCSSFTSQWASSVTHAAHHRSYKHHRNLVYSPPAQVLVIPVKTWKGGHRGDLCPLRSLAKLAVWDDLTQFGLPIVFCFWSFLNFLLCVLDSISYVSLVTTEQGTFLGSCLLFKKHFFF